MFTITLQPDPRIDEKLTLFDQESEDADYYVLSPMVALERGKNPSLTFSIIPGHPCYDKIVKMVSLLEVFDGEERIFSGRAIKTNADFFNQISVECEGRLSFLNDSVIAKIGSHTETPRAHLQRLLDEHNNQVEDWKKIFVGDLDFPEVDKSRKYTNSSYTTTLSAVNSDILNKFDLMYTVTVKEDGKAYLNAFKKYTSQADQAIVFGDNLIDLSRNENSGLFFTVLLPLGKNKITVQKAKKGNGTIYMPVSEQAVQKYGRIVHIENFSEVGKIDELYDKGLQYIQDFWHEQLDELSVSAIDFSYFGDNVSPIRVGDNVRIVSKPHNIDKMYPCKSIKIDLVNPDRTQYTFAEKTPGQNANNSDQGRASVGGGGGITDISSNNIKWDQNSVAINSNNISIVAQALLTLSAGKGTVEINGKTINIGDDVTPGWAQNSQTPESMGEPTVLNIRNLLANQKTTDANDNALKLVGQRISGPDGLQDRLTAVTNHVDEQKQAINGIDAWISTMQLYPPTWDKDGNLNGEGGVGTFVGNITNEMVKNGLTFKEAFDRAMQGSYLNQTRAMIETIVRSGDGHDGDITSYIKQTAKSLSFSANQIDFTAKNFTIDADHINFKAQAFKIDALRADIMADLKTIDITANSLSASKDISWHDPTGRAAFSGSGHKHSLTIGMDPTVAGRVNVTIGVALADNAEGNSGFFNIADTQFFKDRISAITVGDVRVGDDIRPQEKLNPSTGQHLGWNLNIPLQIDLTNDRRGDRAYILSKQIDISEWYSKSATLTINDVKYDPGAALPDLYTRGSSSITVSNTSKGVDAGPDNGVRVVWQVTKDGGNSWTNDGTISGPKYNTDGAARHQFHFGYRGIADSSRYASLYSTTSAKITYI